MDKKMHAAMMMALVISVIAVPVCLMLLGGAPVPVADEKAAAVLAQPVPALARELVDCERSGSVEAGKAVELPSVQPEGKSPVASAPSKAGGTAGNLRVCVVERPGAKYPRIRVEETWATDPATGERTLVDRKEMAADHVVVRFAGSTGEDEVRAALEAAGLRALDRKPLSGAWLVGLPSSDEQAVPRALARLATLDGVAHAAPDWFVRPTGKAANDPLSSYQWSLKGGQGVKGMDAEGAWESCTGSRDVVVAVIDCGLDLGHPDLRDNVWTNKGEIPGNGKDDDGNGLVDDVHGWNFLDGNADVSAGPEENHATYVAGIIGACGDNGLGVSGVSWKVSIMPLKFMDHEGGLSSEAAEALAYAVSMGVRVSVNSWGGADYDSDFSALLDRAGAAGHVFVASAGNNGRDNDARPRYPSSYTNRNVISVAASGLDDGVPSFSNYGKASIALAAPGVDIVSTMPGGQYGQVFGTSMAAPHVAGTCALLLAARPALSVEEIRDAILSTVDPVEAWKDKCSTGGRLNAGRALRKAMGVAESQSAPAVKADSVAKVESPESRPVASAPSGGGGCLLARP